jgi:hypothetical protein
MIKCNAVQHDLYALLNLLYAWSKIGGMKSFKNSFVGSGLFISGGVIEIFQSLIFFEISCASAVETFFSFIPIPTTV